MEVNFPRVGLFVSRTALSSELIEVLDAVRLDSASWARLRGGGLPALSPEHEAWARSCAPGAEALSAAADEVTRLRQAMVDAVVPPAIALLSLVCTIALGLFSAGFLWPTQRWWAFSLAGIVVIAMVVWSTLRALRSSRKQRDLQEALFRAAESLTDMRRRGDRARRLLMVLGIESASGTVPQGGWSSPASDPDRLLLLPRALLESSDAGWLARLAQVRALLVEGEPLLQHPDVREVHIQNQGFEPSMEPTQVRGEKL